MTKTEVSIGDLFEQLEVIRAVSLQAAKKTTEFYEKDVAQQLHDLGSVVADILYVLREHLSCHDCKIVDHLHHIIEIPVTGKVLQLFPNELVEGGESTASEESTTTET